MNKTPKLRFKGFSGDWESKKLGDLTVKTGIKNKYNEDYDVYSISNKYGFIPQDEQFENSRLSGLDKSLYKIVGKGEFAYNPARINVGSIGVLEEDKKVIVSSLYVCFRLLEQMDYRFFKTYFGTCKFNKDVIRNTEGSVREYLFYENFSRIKITIPKLEEQEKITSLFSLIDDKIALQCEKVDAIKEYKKGMMQKIFSRALRFKDDDGKDYPEWEEKKLGDIGNFTSGTGFAEKYQGHLNLPIKVFKVSDMNLSGNQKYMVNANNTISHEILKKMKSKSIDKPSIIFAKVGAAIFLERKRIVNTEFIMDNNMMAFIPSNKNNIEFIHSLISNIQLSRYAQIGALPSYNASDISSIKVQIPCLEEQNKISIALCSIDNKINKEQEKLDSLNEYKKGLLQHMFVY